MSGRAQQPWGRRRLRRRVWVLAALTILAASAITASAPASSPPTVTGLSPNHGPVPGKVRVRINGTNFTGATAVHFGANPATSFTVMSSKLIVAVDPLGVGTVAVTVTTPEGTSAEGPGDEFTYIGKTPEVGAISPKKAPAAGGASVTITGANLYGATAVEFGSVPAQSYTVNGEKSITAVVPAETVGTVAVTVTTPYGTSNDEFHRKDAPPLIGANNFKFEEPTVAELSPDHGTVAGGTEVTITGTGFAVGSTGTTFKFGSTEATSVECESITTCTVVTPPHKAGSEQVIVTVGGHKNATSTAPHFTFE